ncbi:MAG: hypothetical protein HY298_20910 [Verrucomicrobia bacterium]|nr:hypothetical protein [Verrucomicrobiota bacterium]
MGQYLYLINLDKKQVVHPHQIGNGLKLHEQIGWRYSTSTAPVMLLASSSKDGGRGGGDFHAKHPLVGSWAGDRIAFVGDYAEPDDLPGCDAALLYAQCNAACNPREADRRPAGWQEWTNLSAQVREMMMAEFHLRYVGEGWMDIVEENRKKAAPNLCPDLVITSAVGANPGLN